MSRFAFDNMTRLAWLEGSDAINDITGPTTAELAGEVDLSNHLPKNGWQPGNTPNMVDSATIVDTFDAQGVGTWGGGLTVEFYKDNEPVKDVAYSAFTYGQEGFLIIRFGIPYDTAWADGQPVEVWPVQAHEPLMNQPEANTQARFTVGFAVTRTPALHAVVGGGS